MPRKRRFSMFRTCMQEFRAMRKEPGFDPSDKAAVAEALTLRVQARMGDEDVQWTGEFLDKLMAFMEKILPLLLMILPLFLGTNPNPSE